MLFIRIHIYIHIFILRTCSNRYIRFCISCFPSNSNSFALEKILCEYECECKCKRIWMLSKNIIYECMYLLEILKADLGNLTLNGCVPLFDPESIKQCQRQMLSSSFLSFFFHFYSSKINLYMYIEICMCMKSTLVNKRKNIRKKKKIYNNFI